MTSTLSTTTSKPLPDCPRCDGTGIDPRSLPAIPASYYQPAEGGAPCGGCGGSGEGPAPCLECGEPSSEQAADGSYFCVVCAAAAALDAERVLQSVRELLARSPRLATRLAKARGLCTVANDLEAAS